MESVIPPSMDHAEPSNMDPAIPSNLEQAIPPSMDHAEPSNMDPAILSNLEQAIPPSMEQAEAHTGVEPPCHRVLATPEMFLMIITKLELWEQIKMRRVCSSWKTKIEDQIQNREPITCLMINVKEALVGELHLLEQEPRRVQTWQPNASIRRMQFEFAYRKPENASSRQAQITISDRAFNGDTAKALGALFSKIQTLIVYWDTDDSEKKIDVLFEMMILMCSELTSFGFIMSGSMNNMQVLPKICSAMNTHGRPLEQLHLMVPNGGSIEDEQYGGLVEIHPIIGELEKATEMVTNFSLSSIWHNYLAHVGKLGAKSNTPLDSLSLHPKVATDVIKDLRSAKDKFVSVKRLQLVEISRLKDVQKVVKFFPNVEQLHLTFDEPSGEIFNFEWIRALKPLTKLTELTLLNFLLDNLTLSIATTDVDDFENLDQLRTLTIASPDQFVYFRLGNAGPFFPGHAARHIANTIGVQFTGLRELNLWSGDSDLPQTDNKTWQEVEQKIKEELPTLLPQMPELQIDVQLCHPIMHSLYLSLDAEERQHNMDTLTEFERTRLFVCNTLIARSKHNPEYLTRLLNGNFGEEDREIISRFASKVTRYEKSIQAAHALDSD